MQTCNDCNGAQYCVSRSIPISTKSVLSSERQSDNCRQSDQSIHGRFRRGARRWNNRGLPGAVDVIPGDNVYEWCLRNVAPLKAATMNVPLAHRNSEPDDANLNTHIFTIKLGGIDESGQATSVTDLRTEPIRALRQLFISTAGEVEGNLLYTNYLQNLIAMRQNGLAGVAHLLIMINQVAVYWDYRITEDVAKAYMERDVDRNWVIKLRRDILGDWKKGGGPMVLARYYYTD